jgi:hypothetical protein
MAPIDSSICQFQTAFDCIRRHPIVVAHVFKSGGDTSNIKIKVEKKTRHMDNQTIVQRIGFLKAYMNTSDWKQKDSLERIKFISSSDSIDVIIKSFSWQESRTIEESESLIWQHYEDAFISELVPLLNNQVSDSKANDLSVTFCPYVSGTLIAELRFTKWTNDSSDAVKYIFLFRNQR